MIKRIARRTVNLLGIDIMRLRENTMLTLLGIRHMPIYTVIDVGANTGQFARQARRLFPRARLLCFEPLPGPFRELERWASRQQNVTLFNMALGDSEGPAKMFHHLEHSPSSSLLATTELSGKLYPFTKSQSTIDVPLRRLDTALSATGVQLSPEVLIKVDVQGYEEHVINGGKEMFSRAKACVLELNVDPLYSGQANFDRIVLMLHDLGLNYAGNLEQNYDTDGHVIFLDAVFVR